MQRYLEARVRKDLKKKMVFIAGPRQVGKTTFAIQLHPVKETTYLNWDIDEDRTRILDKDLGQTACLIFDEIHKYRRWRNDLKGIYDSIKIGRVKWREILVTGSARLDIYRFGGDSLQGRFYYLRLLPFTLKELGGEEKTLQDLMVLSGFPEPFFSGSEAEAKRWSREYRARIVRDEINDLENLKDLASVELLAGRLPDCVGSPLSYNALREDLQVAHKTVVRWIDILERLFMVFRIAPIAGPRIQAVKKEQKLYFFDWTQVVDESLRFENLIAVHLLKHVYWLQDSTGRDVELRFFRDSNGREVDFVMVENRKPFLLVECKYNVTQLSPSLRYLKAKYPSASAYQLHLHGKKDYSTSEDIRVCSAVQLLKELI